MKSEPKILHQHFYEKVDLVTGGDAHFYDEQLLQGEITVADLEHRKAELNACLVMARKAVFFSAPVIFFVFTLLGMVGLIIWGITQWNPLLGVGNYIFVFPVLILIANHFSRKKIEEYAPVIYDYRQELALIQKELVHRKIRSR